MPKEVRPKREPEHAFTCQVCWAPVATVTKIGRCDACEDQHKRMVVAYHTLIAAYPEFQTVSLAETYERLVFRALKAGGKLPKTRPPSATKNGPVEF